MTRSSPSTHFPNDLVSFKIMKKLQSMNGCVARTGYQALNQDSKTYMKRKQGKGVSGIEKRAYRTETNDRYQLSCCI